MKIPICPKHHSKLERAEITQGKKSLGFIWICRAKKDCHYALDDEDVISGKDELTGEPVIYQEKEGEHASI